MGKTKSLIIFNNILYSKSNVKINFKTLDKISQIKEIVKKFKEQKSGTRDFHNFLNIKPISSENMISFGKCLFPKMNEETPKRNTFCDKNSKFSLNNKKTQKTFFSAERNLNQFENFLNVESEETAKQKKEGFVKQEYNFKIQNGNINENQTLIQREDARSDLTFFKPERHSNNCKIQNCSEINFLKLPERNSYSNSPLIFLQKNQKKQPFDLAKTLKHFRNKSIDSENKLNSCDQINKIYKIEEDSGKKSQQLKEVLKNYKCKFDFELKPNRESLKERLEKRNLNIN